MGVCYGEAVGTQSDPRPFLSLCSAQQVACVPIPSLGSQVAHSRCLQRHWPLASYLYFMVQEGIGFPEPISNYRNLGSLGKLTDLKSSDPAPASRVPPRRHAAFTRGHPAGSGSSPPARPAPCGGTAGGRWPVTFTCGERLLVSAGSSLDRMPN